MGGARDLVATVERALRQRARRRVAARWTARGLAGTTALAAAAAIVLALRGAPHSSDPTAAGSGSGRTDRADPFAADGRLDPRALVIAEGIGSSSALSPGADVSAPRGQPVRLTSAEGTELVLEAGSSLTVMEMGPTRRFALLRGAVRAQVHELRAGDRFLIDTSDAEVEVHGTRFRVETGVNSGEICEPVAGATHAGRPVRGRAVATRVSVQAGIVAVRSAGREVRLLAGDTWPGPVACTASTPPPSRPISGPARSRPIAAQARPPRPNEPRESAPPETPGLGPAPVANGAPRPAGAEASDLPAQNNLFSAAVAARRSGQIGRALALYQQLIDRYPDSSLVESALAARMRVLAEQRDARAARAAAAAYLARFPDGFARAEARELRQTEAQHP